MSTLDDIKARADELVQVSTRELASKLIEYGEEYTLLAKVEADHRRLIAALEAVEQLLAEKYDLYAAICGETCVKDIPGVDHEAIADNIAANIRSAIKEALS